MLFDILIFNHKLCDKVEIYVSYVHIICNVSHLENIGLMLQDKYNDYNSMCAVTIMLCMTHVMFTDAML